MKSDGQRQKIIHDILFDPSLSQRFVRENDLSKYMYIRDAFDNTTLMHMFNARIAVEGFLYVLK